MDKMREEFEKWALGNNYDLSVIPDGTYYVGITFHAWQAWQASRSALVVKIPEEHDLGNGTVGVLQDDFAKSLEDSGISYE